MSNNDFPEITMSTDNPLEISMNKWMEYALEQDELITAIKANNVGDHYLARALRERELALQEASVLELRINATK